MLIVLSVLWLRTACFWFLAGRLPLGFSAVRFISQTLPRAPDELKQLIDKCMKEACLAFCYSSFNACFT